MDATESDRPFVAVVCGNASDVQGAEHAANVLDKLHIPYEIKVLQAGSEDIEAYIEEAMSRGLGVVIVSTYYTYTDELIPSIREILLPVVRFATGPIPKSIRSASLNIPLMGFGREGAIKAALFAARVLALTDYALRLRLRAYSQPSSFASEPQ